MNPGLVQYRLRCKCCRAEFYLDVFCVHETPLVVGGVCGTCLFLNDVHDRWPEDAVELLEGPQDASDETAALSPEQA